MNPLRSLSLLSVLLLHNVGSFSVASLTSRPSRKATALCMWGKAKEPSNTEHDAPTMAKITTITSLDEYMDFLKEDERLCIVKFHAAWCKSCQKFGVSFRQLAKEHGDLVLEKDSKKPQPGVYKQGKVRFAQVEFGQNVNLCRALEVKRLPSVHLYKSHLGKLTGFSAGPKKFHLVTEAVERFLPLSDKEIEFELEMEKGSALADSLVATEMNTMKNATSNSA